MKERIIQIIFTTMLACLFPVLSAAQIDQPSPVRHQLDQILTVIEPAERIVALENFINAHANDALAAIALEEIIRSRAQMAEQQLAENNIARALELFHRAAAQLPEKISDQFFEVTVARMPFAISARGYRAEAIAFARLLEERFTKEPLRLGALGEFYLNLEAAHEAIRALETAIKLAPDEIRLLRPLAVAYRMGLRLDDAQKKLQQIIALDRDDHSAYVDLGNLARARGDYAEAERLYRSQLRINAQNLTALKGLALTELAQGRENQAEVEFEKIREFKGSDEIDRDLHLQTQMAFYYLAQNKLEAATQAVVRALAIEPRYSWGRIAAAEIDLAEGRIFEAEQHLLAALRNADFATLRFALGKLYLTVEDFDGALEQLMHITRARDFDADSIQELLARERQAAIFLATPLSSGEQFAFAAALVQFDKRLSDLKPAGVEGASAVRRSRAARSNHEVELEQAVNAFVDAEATRRAFRALYVAQRLAQSSVALPLALKLADRALDLAETAVAPDGALRDYPNYDREGRLRIVRGRALDIRGWALSQMKRHKEAVISLTEAIEAYGGLPEGKRAMWRLGMVKELVGEPRAALDLYLAAYEPPTGASATDIKRSVIEALYRKVHGSLDGINERLGSIPTHVVIQEPQSAMKHLALEEELQRSVIAMPPTMEEHLVKSHPLSVPHLNMQLLRWPGGRPANITPSPASIPLHKTQVETRPISSAGARPRRVSKPYISITDEPQAHTRSRRIKERNPNDQHQN